MTGTPTGGGAVAQRSAGSRRGAFTLIELLVVIAIVALLISILLPSLKTARMQAQAVVCASNTKQILTALVTYQMDSKGSMPMNLWSEAAWWVPKRDLWFYKLCDPNKRQVYLPDPRVFVCPGDPFASRFNYNAMHPNPKQKPHWETRVPSCGYGMNYLLRHMGEPHAFNIERYPPKRPANTILLAEVGPDDVLVLKDLFMRGDVDPPMGQPWRDGGRIIWDDGIRGWYSGPTWLTARHLGKINMASMDTAVHRVRTTNLLRTGIRPSPYADCKAGGCVFCNYEPTTPHYNFTFAKLFWWTGPVPSYPR